MDRPIIRRMKNVEETAYSKRCDTHIGAIQIELLIRSLYSNIDKSRIWKKRFIGSQIQGVSVQNDKSNIMIKIVQH